jgi:hypothetical protein
MVAAAHVEFKGEVPLSVQRADGVMIVTAKQDWM